jgi:hypothetical protein
VRPVLAMTALAAALSIGMRSPVGRSTDAARCGAAPAAATQPPPGAPGRRGRDATRRRHVQQPDPIDFQANEGWTSLFDGQTLKGWSGDQNWKVEDGAITIESTCEKPTGTV